MRAFPARIAVTAASLTLAACSPWTVRPIEDSNQATAASMASQSPVVYAESIWTAKLIPGVSNAAVDARALLDALAASPENALERYGRREGSGQAYFAVKGKGRVIRLETASRNGIALVDVAPFDGRADLSIQIGPVMRGTSLRDCCGIVRFTDFINQLQFADVAMAFNDVALRSVIAPLDKASLKGKPVSFVGALAAEMRADPPLRDLAPIQLSLEGDR